MGIPANAPDLRRRPASARAPSSWPFRSTQPLHATQITEFGVGVPTRQEVEFKDGQRIWLKRVIVNGAPCLFLRDLGAPAEGVRIDLRKLINNPSLHMDAATELPTTSTRDVADYVQRSLRLLYLTRESFLEAAVRCGRPA
jgi:hypothetical protein